MIIFILLIISVIIYVVYVSNKKTSSSENVVHTQESMQHQTVVSGCPTEVIDAANEAIEILEQGAKLYLSCMTRHHDKDNFVGAVMNIISENNSAYSVTVMCAYPELVSACDNLNIFSEFPYWHPAHGTNGTTDYMKIKRIGSKKIDTGSWSAFEQKTKELVSQKHPEWIYTGQKMTNFTIVFE